jgi:hypothetical protein
MSLKMLIKEMAIHELGICPSSSEFIDGFSLVKKFMTSNSIETTEIAPL